MRQAVASPAYDSLQRISYSMPLRASGGRKTLEAIVAQCNSVLKNKLGYEQQAQLYRPREHRQTHFPGKAPAAKKKS